MKNCPFILSVHPSIRLSVHPFIRSSVHPSGSTAYRVFVCVCRSTNSSNWSVRVGDDIKLLGQTLSNEITPPSFMPASFVKLGPPPTPRVVKAELRSQSGVPFCLPVTLETGMSTGSEGRAFEYTWSLESVQPVLTSIQETELGAHLANYNKLQGTPDSTSLFIFARLLPPGRTYNLKVTLTNWLGFNNSAMLALVRPAMPAARVQLDGPALRTSVLGQAFTASALLELEGACGDFAVSSFVWDLRTGPAEALAKVGGAPLSKTGQVTLPPSFLLPSSEYELRVNATCTVGGQTAVATSIITIRTPSVPTPLVSGVSLSQAAGDLVLELKFDAATNLADMAYGAPCSILLADITMAKLAENSPRCAWRGPKLFIISWSGTSTIVEGSLRLNGGVLKSADGYSRALPITNTPDIEISDVSLLAPNVRLPSPPACLCLAFQTQQTATHVRTCRWSEL